MLENCILKVIPSAYQGITVGEKILFYAYLNNASHQEIAGKVHYKICKNIHDVLKEGELDLADITPAAEIVADEPCSIQCEMTFRQGDDEISKTCGVMVEPLRIEPAVSMPDDFDQFWDGWKQKLAAVPINAKVEKFSNNHIDTYDVTLDCIGGKPVKGILGMPKDRDGKRFPVAVAFQGAGVRSARLEGVLPMVNRGIITLEINAHGLENMKPIDFYKEVEAELSGYSTAGFDSDQPEDIYFLNMFLRTKRAVEFMTTLKEWDGKNLFVEGSSMGAFQSFAAAYLDQRVSAIAVGMPAGSNIIGGGWPLCGDYKDLDPEKKQRLEKILPYFDNVNFARRLATPATFVIGLIDGVCSPDSIYAVYNSLSGEKSISEDPEIGHEMPLPAKRQLWDFLVGQIQC